MCHGRGPHARAGIGRTSREKTVGIAVGNTQFRFERLGGIRGQGIAAFQVEPRLHGLDPDVVLFIDHDRQRFIPADDDTVMFARLGQVLADQMFLHQGQAVDFAQRFQVDGQEFTVALRIIAEKRVDDLIRSLGSLACIHPVREGILGQISGQPDPAGNDDIAFRSLVDVPAHSLPPPSWSVSRASRVWISSRSRAAFS